MDTHALDVIDQELFPNNPEKRAELERRFQYWNEKSKPFEDALRRSSILSAKDYSIRVGPCYD